MRILLILTAFAAVGWCASGGVAQTKKPSVGNYKTVSVEDAKVVEAADFAVMTQAEKYQAIIELASIEKAEIQVAAGTNYRFCMKIYAYTDSGESEDDEETEGVTAFVIAVVFQNSDGKSSLTNWTVVENCGKR